MSDSKIVTTLEIADTMYTNLTYLITYLLDHRPTGDTMKLIDSCQKTQRAYKEARNAKN